MKGFITRFAAGSVFAAGVFAMTGCNCYRDIVDPCWPERYDKIARDSVRDITNAQSEKGHILDQTVWNWHFDHELSGAPTAVLNGAGIETLKIISRRIPAPDFQVYLQTAQDLPFVANVPPERINAERAKLNERRIQAIQSFLATQAPLNGGGAYMVRVHDLVPPSMPAHWTDKAQENYEKSLKTGTPQNFVQPKLQ